MKRRYLVKAGHRRSVRIDALSRGKAKYIVWKAMRDDGWDWPFWYFLKVTTALCLGPSE